MPTYTIENGDTLPRVAEKLGHAGEWLTLALANLALVPDEDQQYSDEAKAALIAERMTPGVELQIPMEWNDLEIEPPATSSVVPASSMTAAELIALAKGASTLAELDAIDAAAAGRVSVSDAVDARRQTLLDQGATV